MAVSELVCQTSPLTRVSGIEFSELLLFRTRTEIWQRIIEQNGHCASSTKAFVSREKFARVKKNGCILANLINNAIGESVCPWISYEDRVRTYRRKRREGEGPSSIQS